MASPWIDISMPLSPDMPVWPGNESPSIAFARSFDEGHRSISSVLTTNQHNGTHIDAPLHFTPNGATVDELPIDLFIGHAQVVDCTGASVVDADVLEERVPSDVERLLLRTDNSLRRSSLGSSFDTSFVGLTVDAAHWIVQRGIKLVGNDYPSIAVYKGDAEIHLALMRAGVGILEGIVLDHVQPGSYELSCLPLNVVGAEGAPARAVIRSRS